MKCLDISNNIAQNQLRESMNNKIVLVLFHSDTCGYCKMMMPAFEQFYNQEPNHQDVLISKIEKQHMNRFPIPVDIQGYPTIKMYGNNREIDTYDENERTAESFSKFLKKHLQQKLKKSRRPSMSSSRLRSKPRKSVRSARSASLKQPSKYLSKSVNDMHLDLLRRRSQSNFDKNMSRLTSKLDLKNKSLPLTLRRSLSLKQPNTLKLATSKSKPKKKKKSSKKKKKSTKKKKKKSSKK